MSSPGNVLEHKSQATLPPGAGRGSRSNAAPTTSDPNPFLTPLPCCPSSLSPLAAPRLRNYGCFLALLVFLCFAPRIRELWEVLALFQSHCSGVCSGFWGGFRLFMAPQGRCGLGQAPLLLQPWSGHKSPGRGTATHGASLGWVRHLGRDSMDLPSQEAHPAFPG